MILRQEVMPEAYGKKSRAAVGIIPFSAIQSTT
jgi:hypothetical protein